MNRTLTTSVAAALLAVLLGACSSQSEETDRALRDAEVAASEAAVQVSEAADEVDDAIDEAMDQVTSVPTVAPAGDVDVPSFHTAAGFGLVQAEIAAAVGTADARLVDLAVFPDHFTFSAVNPDRPSEVDEYTYVNGAMLDPRPVDHGGDEKALKANLFPATLLTPAALELFASEAVLLSQVEGGVLQHVVVARGLPFTKDVQLTGHVTSDRDSATVTGNVEGSVLKVS